jgi:hypothetical protein
MFPTKFRFIWPSGFREDLKKSANQKQELPVVAMFVNGVLYKVCSFRPDPLTNMTATGDSCF